VRLLKGSNISTHSTFNNLFNSGLRIQVGLQKQLEVCIFFQRKRVLVLLSQFLAAQRKDMHACVFLSTDLKEAAVAS
jgi:hypothetical protein